MLTAKNAYSPSCTQGNERKNEREGNNKNPALLPLLEHTV